MYGDEESGVPPDELYDEEDAIEKPLAMQQRFSKQSLNYSAS
jgi:hypothetical protein